MPFSVGVDIDKVVRSTNAQDGLAKIQAAITEYNSYKDRLLEVPFTTVEDYLNGLEALASLTVSTTQDSQQRAIFYLPAAVSDFYLPARDLTEHKI